MAVKFTNYDKFNESLADIFHSAHAAIDKKDLQPLKKFIGKPKFPTQEEVDEACEFLGIDPEHLFYNKKDILHPILYWKGPIYYGFFGGLNMATLKMMQVDKYFEQKTKYVDEMLKKKDYERLFYRVDKKILIPTFMEMYQEIPDSQKYDVFIDLYTRSEFGFGMFPKPLVKDCFSKRHLSSEWKERMKEFEKRIGGKEEITVYRGEGAISTPDSYSWSLSRKTAKFFADRFAGGGKIKTRKVKPDQVIDYLTGRGESEVLLDFSSMNESFYAEPFGKPGTITEVRIFSSFYGADFCSIKMLLKDDAVKVFFRNPNPNMGETVWFTLDENRISIMTRQTEQEIVQKIAEALEKWTKIYSVGKVSTDGELTVDFLVEHPVFGKWWKDCLNKYRGKLMAKKFGM